MLYTSLKLVHVLLAIVAVGFNVSYGLVIGRARKAGVSELRFALRVVKFMDDKIANPCYLLLVVTGVGMVQVSGLPWALTWIHGSMALVLVAIVIGFALYTPTLRKQIEALDAGGPNSPEFLALSKRGSMLGGILGLIILAIITMMVFKPA